MYTAQQVLDENPTNKNAKVIKTLAKLIDQCPGLTGKPLYDSVHGGLLFEIAEDTRWEEIGIDDNGHMWIANLTDGYRLGTWHKPVAPGRVIRYLATHRGAEQLPLLTTLAA